MHVLLHGFTGAPCSWDAVRERLSGPAVAPALPGHGGAHVAGWEEAVDRIAARAAGAHLVGYSLGARLALGVLVRHPGLVRRATLIGVNPGVDDRAARVRWEDALADRLEADGLGAFVAHWEQLPMWASQARLPEATRAAQRRVRMGHDPGGLAHSLRALGLGRMPDLRPALPTLDTPVALVVGGEDDRFRAVAEQMAAVMPTARVHVVAGVGHNVVLEAPEALARLLD